jgi:hypothetical protein
LEQTNEKMNAKQTIQIITKVAPPLAVGALFILLLKEIFSGRDKEKLEKASEKVAPLPNPFNSGRNSFQNPCIPANSAGKATVPLPLSAFPAKSTPTVREKTVPPPSVVPALKAVPKFPLPAQKKVITREDMATAFHRGTSALTRTAAVAALRNLGFGKTAAYAALSPDGRFSAWLRFAPDGIITWNYAKTS